MEEQSWRGGRALAEKAFSATCAHSRLEQVYIRGDEPYVSMLLHWLGNLIGLDKCPGYSDSGTMLTTWAKQPLHTENLYCKSNVHSL